MKIEITTTAKKEDTEVLSRGIIKYNKTKVPDLEPNESEVKFFAFAKKKNGEIGGGIRATCYWNTLHIELLWLSESQRGSGIGAKLIESIEDFAKQNNCDKAFVKTTSWQARPFYEKMGFTLMGTIQDRPKGHATHYLTKNLS